MGLISTAYYYNLECVYGTDKTESMEGDFDAYMLAMCKCTGKLLRDHYRGNQIAFVVVYSPLHTICEQSQKMEERQNCYETQIVCRESFVMICEWFPKCVCRSRRSFDKLKNLFFIVFSVATHICENCGL